MRALVQDEYGPPEVLRLEDVDSPPPGDDDVLVRVRASSINMADVDYLLGRPWLARLGTGLRRPRIRIPGTDMAGVVEAVGSKVSVFAPGDEVFADLTNVGGGAYAELVSVPADALTKKPARLSFEEAACLPSAGILAFQGLRGGRDLAEGARVLINGAGGNVGPLAIQLAKSRGAEVTATDRADKLELVRTAGADHVLDYTTSDYTSADAPYDFILDMAAYRPLLAARRALARGGRYMVLGGPVHRFFSTPLLGLLLLPFGRKRMGMPMWEANRREDMEALRVLAEEGHLRPIITRTVPLAEVPDGMRDVIAGEFSGKIAVRV
jgi:NADPH:quinone reductase-like Zn-dependent oxidoreductase